jgi:metal transporter CNNM
MKWRASVGADTILEEFPQSPYFKFLTSHYPSNHTDPECPKTLRCRDGSHMCIENMGTLSTEAAALVPTEEIIKYHIYAMELAEKIRSSILKESGYHHMMQSFIIEDLADLGLDHLGMVNILKAFTQIDSDNYPETLLKVVIVNVPSIFSLIWKAVQYFWDAKQQAKFQFVQAGYDHGAVLVRAISPEFLPKRYGGTLEYDLPQRLPIEDLKKELAGIPPKQWISAVVPRSEEFSKSFDLEAGSVFHYEFKTADYDVGFGIKFRKANGHPIEPFIESKRFDSNVIPAWGRFKVEKAGTYILVWDNTYSWTRGKDLFYNTSVQK